MDGKKAKHIFGVGLEMKGMSGVSQSPKGIDFILR
jgi:hypothetical protein